MSFVESDFYLAFSCAPNIGPKRFSQYLASFGSAENAWNASPQDLKREGFTPHQIDTLSQFKQSFSIKTYLEKLSEVNVEFVASCSEDFPDELFALDSCPIGLFIRGKKELLHAPSGLAVVGARKMTSYGADVTATLVGSMAVQGVVIISGLALGVDAAAHSAALEVKGSTIAVLGCGVDCCYPQENLGIYRQIITNGGLVLSEYPLATPPSKGSFPARNRIIAALAQAVLVTEAGVDSGSLITASNAASLGRKIFAVPGPITSRQSDGTTKLIKEGAILVSSADDITAEMRVRKDSQGNHISIDPDMLPITQDQKNILKLLLHEPLHINMLSAAGGVPIAALTPILVELEMMGYISTQNGTVSFVS